MNYGSTKLLAGLSLGVVFSAITLWAIAPAEALAPKKEKKDQPHHHDRSADAGPSPSANARASRAASDAGPPRHNPPQSAVQPAAFDGGLLCYYGKTRDAHSGQDRCLSPEELDPPRVVIADTRAIAEQLGMMHDGEPDASVAFVSDGGEVEADASVDVESPSTTGYKARVVRVSFENGAVGHVQKFLENKTDAMEACVADNGGLHRPATRVKLMFLVRPRGIAEGMIISSARNVPPRVVSCVKKLIEHQHVGTPSNDPVGVTVLLELKEADTDAEATN